MSRTFPPTGHKIRIVTENRRTVGLWHTVCNAKGSSHPFFTIKELASAEQRSLLILMRLITCKLPRLHSDKIRLKPRRCRLRFVGRRHRTTFNGRRCIKLPYFVWKSLQSDSALLLASSAFSRNCDLFMARPAA